MYATFFTYWYAPLCSIASAICGYWIAVSIQNRQFHREDMIRKQEEDCREFRRRPNPIELDILRHCREQLSEDGQYHFQQDGVVAFINRAQVGNHMSSAVRDNLHSLETKEYIDIFYDADYCLSFTFVIDSEKLTSILKETEGRR